jgi:transcriptional regulator with XRE-family HTH domain
LEPKTEEFLALMKASGWSQAEVARRLHITPGAVSQFCSGKILPKAGTLNLFKMILAKINPAALNAYENSHSNSEDPWKHEIMKALERLPKKEGQRLLESFISMINTFADSLGRKK